MAKIGKIAPIQKTYGDLINTLDQQLAKNGYQRFPGTSEMILPYKERSGRYRTGLDTEAAYLNRLSEEDRAAEVKNIKEAKARLEKELGVPGILDPTSIFYNYSASKEQLVAKNGSDLQVSPIKLGDREEFFDSEDIAKEIAWYWARVHPRIAPSLDAWKTGKVPQDVKYYVVDDEAEERESYNRRSEVNKATIAFEALTPTKKKQIGRLMGLPITESTKEETVYNLMDAELKKTEFTTGKFKGTSPVRLFNELVIMTNDRLRVKDLVEQALVLNIYRTGQGGKVIEGALTISTSVEDLVEHLMDEKNQMDLLALEKKLKIKKIDKL